MTNLYETYECIYDKEYKEWEVQETGNPTMMSFNTDKISSVQDDGDGWSTVIMDNKQRWSVNVDCNELLAQL